MFLMAEWMLHGPEAKEIVDQFKELPSQVVPLAAVGGFIGWCFAAAFEEMPAIFGIVGGMTLFLVAGGSTFTST
jgi:hypothetical protein